MSVHATSSAWREADTHSFPAVEVFTYSIGSCSLAVGGLSGAWFELACL